MARNSVPSRLDIGMSFLSGKIFVVLIFLIGIGFASGAAPVVYFSDLTDGVVSGGHWGGEQEGRGAAVSVWGRGFGVARGGSSFVTVGGVDLTDDSDYAEWGATTNPIVPLGMERITFFLNSDMITGGDYPNTVISVTTDKGTSDSIPFHTRDTGNIYFLDNVNGDDSGLGLTVADAWRTTGYARGSLQAGDVVYLKRNEGIPYHDHDTDGGINYANSLMSFGYGPIDGIRNHYNGAEGESITVTAYPGELVELESETVDTIGSNDAPFACIGSFPRGSQLEYWTFSKMKMTGLQGAMIIGGANTGYTRGGASHVRIIGNDMTTALTVGSSEYSSVGWGTILNINGNANGAEHIDIFGNYLHDQCADYRGQDTGRRVYQVYIGGYGSLDSIDVGWNDMGWGSQGRGFQIYGHLITDTLTNLIMHDNYFHDNARQCVILGGGDGGANYGFVKDCKFYNNIVSNPGPTDQAIHVGGLGWGQYGGDFEIYNNVFYTPQVYPVMVIARHIDSLILKNNIFMTTPNYWDYFSYDGSVPPENITANHNIYYGAGDNAVPSWDDSVLVNDDPEFLFSNPIEYMDFFPSNDSMAVDNGTNEVPFFVTEDFLGVTRPQGAGYDIGAFEYLDREVVLPCEVNWSCSEWTVCLDGFENRTCVDLEGCGVEDGRPGEARSCGEVVCVHDADLEICDGVVNTEELIAYLERWLLGEVSISDVLGAVGAWSG